MSVIRPSADVTYCYDCVTATVELVHLLFFLSLSHPPIVESCSEQEEIIRIPLGPLQVLNTYHSLLDSKRHREDAIYLLLFSSRSPICEKLFSGCSNAS